ncbi:MAG: prepilin peptidase [Patescibacteria group bacterium]
MVFFLLLSMFVFGLVIGSFLNCLIWRLYKEESLWGRSYCPECRHQIAWYDNIPLLSYIILGGHCRHCHKRISWQYPALELLTGVLFVLAGIKNFGGWAQLSAYTSSDILFHLSSARFYLSLGRDYFIIAAMMIVLVYDLRWYLISNLVIWPAAVIIFILNIILGLGWLSSLVFALISAGFFWLQFVVTRRRGLGEGDIWLGLLLGFIFPDLPSWWLMIISSYFLGSLVGLALMISGRKKWGSKLPLGVFLAIGAIIILLFGQAIIGYYLTLRA